MLVLNSTGVIEFTTAKSWQWYPCVPGNHQIRSGIAGAVYEESSTHGSSPANVVTPLVESHY